MKNSFPGLDLCGPWRLEYFDASEAPLEPSSLGRGPSIPATVPGNVELDLLAAGLISDPMRGDHVYDLAAWEHRTWWIYRDFDGTQIPSDTSPELVFEGVDCLADIWLNGKLVGSAANALIAHRVPIADVLVEGHNTLAICIHSAVIEGRKHVAGAGEHTPAPEALRLRKPAHAFGWDIMPRVVSAGLWRPVRIEFVPKVRFTSVYWATISCSAARAKAALQVDWQFSDPGVELSGWNVDIALHFEGAMVVRRAIPAARTRGRLDLEVENPHLWWPRGTGAPCLHEATIELSDASGAVVAKSVETIGIRVVELERTDVTSRQGAGKFQFVVNGEPVFIRGTNWVPLDALHSRDVEHLERTFHYAVDLNCNMLRCWGGNVYEDHEFFDLCDRHGIMVWQDFALACGVYPQSDDFAKALGVEAEAIVRKLRNHACVVLWCGDNEGDVAYYWRYPDLDPNEDRPTREVLAKAVRSWDPFRPYLPSSPFHGPAFYQQRDISAMRRNGGTPWGNLDFHTFADVDLLPEVHLWWALRNEDGPCGPYQDYKGRLYTALAAHFISEIGYVGCMERESLARIAESPIWPPHENEEWLTRCIRPTRHYAENCDRIEVMERSIAVLFDRVPGEHDQFVQASQFVQAEALKFFIESWRAHKGKRSGILWWHLRDGWPQMALGIVDYFHKPKQAYYAIRQSQQTVCLIVDEAENGAYQVVAVNDSRGPVEGEFEIRGEGGDLLLSGALEVPANGLSIIGGLPEVSVAQLWILEWFVRGQEVVSWNHYLAGPRPVDLGMLKRWVDTLSERRGGSRVCQASTLTRSAVASG